MGKDTPDYGGIYNSAQFYPLFDMAELAARLGSPITYDRRGSLIWHYAFEDGIGDVGPVESGVGSDVRLSATVWESPPFSCVLQAGTAAGAYAQIERRMAIPQSLRVGFQASMRASSNVSKMYLRIIHFDGSTAWYAYLRVDLDNGDLRVYGDSTLLATLDSAFPDLTTGYYFAHFKLVVDLSTHMLVRGLVDDQEYDLSAYAIPGVADATAPHLYVSVRNEGENLVASNVNVDTLIVTAAEP